jgi:ELWxxDGT repeat protein
LLALNNVFIAALHKIHLIYGAPFVPDNALKFEPLEIRYAFSSVPYMVADVNDTSDGVIPDRLTAVGEQVFFLASDSQHGLELWKSDGTANGTSLVKDIRPDGSAFSLPARLVNVGGVLFFHANDGVHGNELWKSDGTESGTVMVKDIAAGAESSLPGNLYNFNGTLLFDAYGGANGGGLWRSDGTATGTYLLKDVYPAAGSIARREFTEVNGLIYFIGDATSGDRLWRTNGTTAGTIPLSPTNVGRLTNVNGALYFVGDGGLWKLNSTSLTMISTGSQATRDFTSLVNVGGTLFFTKWDATTGLELWKSNGTQAGTVRIKDIHPGSNDSYPRQLTNVSGTLFFVADDTTFNDELWKSDGTPEGTVKVKEIMDSWSGSDASYLTNVNGTLYFRADGNFASDFDDELWKSDGTNAGTVRVADIRAGNRGSDPRRFVNVAGKLYFTANDGSNGPELWSLRPAPVGDYSLDGRIDGTDFLAWQRAFGSSATPAGEGADGNSDGVVDGHDLQIWADSYSSLAMQIAPSEFDGERAVQRLAADSVFAHGDFTSLFSSAPNEDRLGSHSGMRIHRARVRRMG